MRSICVFGVGNILLSDEGVGIKVVEELKNRNRIRNTTYTDLGTSSQDLGFYIDQTTELVIIIDCMALNNFEAGTVFRLAPGDVHQGMNYKLSLHQIHLIESLKLLEIKHEVPKTILIGIQPHDASTWSTSLSEILEGKFQSIVEKIEDIIVRLTESE